MREQLFRSEKLAAAGQLISDVANELRSPLQSIATLATTLRSQNGDAHRIAELESITTEARRAIGNRRRAWYPSPTSNSRRPNRWI